MKIKLLILVIYCFGLTGYSQKVKKEVVVSDGVKNNISATATGMYNGTKSKKAKEFFKKAASYTNNQDNKNAIKYYLKAIKEDVNFVEAYDNLGRIYRSQSDYDKSEKYYLKSLKIYPSGIMAHQNLAVVYGIRKEYDKAILQYIEIVKLSPKNAEGYFGLANTYMMNKDYKKALVNAKKAVDIYEKESSHYINEGYFLLGLIHYYSGDKDQAKEYILKAKEKGANIDPQLLEELGIKSEEKTTIDKEKITKKQLLKAINWIQETPLDKEKDTRKALYGFLMNWMTDCDITIEITEEIVPYTESIDCMMIFMTGWVQQVLTTKNEDKLTSNLYATERVMEFYDKNKSIIGENFKIEKFKKLKEKGKLKKFIKSNIH